MQNIKFPFHHCIDGYFYFLFSSSIEIYPAIPCPESVSCNLHRYGIPYAADMQVNTLNHVIIVGALFSPGWMASRWCSASSVITAGQEVVKKMEEVGNSGTGTPSKGNKIEDCGLLA